MEEKFIIDTLVLEITRDCTCECDHCLRGDKEDIHMPNAFLRYIFGDGRIEGINNITFTGGEPSLNIQFIEKTLEICKQEKISVRSIFVATNGLQNQLELIMVMNQWMDYCMECCGYRPYHPAYRWKDVRNYLDEEPFSLSCSIDQFHPEMDPDIKGMFHSVIYYSKQKELSYNLNGRGRQNGVNLILSGKAYEYGFEGQEPLPFEEFHIYNDVIDMVYVTALGYVYAGCNSSYDEMDACNQEENDIRRNKILDIIIKTETVKKAC